MLWVQHVMRLYMHSFCARERDCSVTQHQVSARQSACTHVKEDLTASRLVRVIYSSHIMYNRVGTVSLSVMCRGSCFLSHSKRAQSVRIRTDTTLDQDCRLKATVQECTACMILSLLTTCVNFNKKRKCLPCICCLIQTGHPRPSCYSGPAPVYWGCPCRDPLGSPPMPKQDGIGDKAPTLICCTAAALLSLY